MTPTITAVAPSTATTSSRAEAPAGSGEDFVDALRAQGGDAGPADRATSRPAGTSRPARDAGGPGSKSRGREGEAEGDEVPTRRAATSADLELPTATAVPTASAAPVVTPAPVLAIPVELAAALAPAGESAGEQVAQPVVAEPTTGVVGDVPSVTASAPSVATTPGLPSGAVPGEVPADATAPDAPTAPALPAGSAGKDATDAKAAIGAEATAAQAVPTVAPVDGAQGASTSAPTPAAQPAVPTVADVVGTAAGASAATAAPTATATVAAPQPAAPPPTAAHVPVPTQVAAAVSPLLRGADGSHQMTLHLSPEGMGRVDVRLHVAAGEVRMQLTATDAVTRELLRDGLPELRSQLEDAGLKATRLDVQTGGASSWGGPTSDRSAPDHRPELRPDRAQPPRGPAPPPSGAVPPRPTSTDSRLDLRM